MPTGKIIITNDTGEQVEATAPVIVSASRSTDIPAFYAKWFFNRLAKGYCAWYNPFNQQKMYISFKNCKVVIFWTKNPKPILPYLHELDEREIHYYFQVTLNDYVKEGFEPNVSSVENRVETFKKLSDMIGKEKVIWRFDPLIITPNIAPRDLLTRIWHIGNKLKGYTNKLVFSFIDVKAYRKVQNNLVKESMLFTKENVENAEANLAQRIEIVEGLQKIREAWHKDGWDVEIATCAEDIDLEKYGIEHNRCIDGELMKRIFADDKELVYLYFARAESSQQLQSEIAGKFTGSVDLLVAGVKVSSEYKNQIEEQKDCLYIWCRDFRTVKCSYFSNDVDLLSDDVVRWCTTRDFRNSVRQDNAEEFVRKYGTHLITTSYLGGKLDYYFTVSQDVKTSTEQIVTTINVKLLWFKKSSTTVDEKVWTEIKKDFEGQFHVSGGGEYGKRLNEEFDKYVSKGEPLQDQTLTDQWYACFENSNTPDEDLVMVDFYVIPIWDIVEVLNPSKAQEIEDYITNKYLKK